MRNKGNTTWHALWQRLHMSGDRVAICWISTPTNIPENPGIVGGEGATYAAATATCARGTPGAHPLEVSVQIELALRHEDDARATPKRKESQLVPLLHRVAALHRELDAADERCSDGNEWHEAKLGRSNEHEDTLVLGEHIHKWRVHGNGVHRVELPRDQLDASAGLIRQFSMPLTSSGAGMLHAEPVQLR